MSEKLEFDITVKNNQLSKALDDASKSASSITNIMKNGVTPAIEETVAVTKNATSGMDSFVSSALSVSLGQAAFNLFNKAVNFVTSSVYESIDAFAEQEDALNKLNQSFNATGSYSESAVNGVLSFASALEKTSRFSDDAIIGQVAFAKSLGATTEQAKSIVQAAANMSATLGGSLEENVDKLGKTLSGVTGRLGMLIPELKTLTAEQLKAGDAADIINSKFSGAAANDLNTYAGQTAALKNSFNNLQESIGELIVKSAPYQLFLQASKSYLDDLNSSINANATFNKVAANGYDVTSQSIGQVSEDSKSLGLQIAKLNQELDQASDSEGYSGQVQNTNALTFEIEKLTRAKAILDKQMEEAPYLKRQTGAPAETNVVSLTPEEKAAAEIRRAELLAVDEKIANERANFQSQMINETIGRELGAEELEIQRIYAFEARKVEIDTARKETEAKAKLDGDAESAALKQISADNELAITQLKNSREISLIQLQNKQKEEAGKTADKKEKDRLTQMAEVEKQTLNTRLGYISAFGNLASALASDGSKAQFLIQKGAAIASSIVSTQLGVAQALALGPILGPPLAANMQLIGNINTAAIVATAIKGFENGGIVGSISGATMGADNRVAKVRDGEMILNGEDQRTLFSAIKSGSFGGGNIQLIIDGREIAYAVRNQVQGGFRLA